MSQCHIVKNLKKGSPVEGIAILQGLEYMNAGDSHGERWAAPYFVDIWGKFQ